MDAVILALDLNLAQQDRVPPNTLDPAVFAEDARRHHGATVIYAMATPKPLAELTIARTPRRLRRLRHSATIELKGHLLDLDGSGWTPRNPCDSNARMLALRINEDQHERLSLHYLPDPVFSRAEDARDHAGAKIRFVRRQSPPRGGDNVIY